MCCCYSQDVLGLKCPIRPSMYVGCPDQFEESEEISLQKGANCIDVMLSIFSKKEDFH